MKLIGARAANAITKHAGISLHLISPVEELAIDTLKDTSNVVGFNSKRVLQLSDSRKRTNIGSTELRSHLKYGSDLGIDMTQGENEGYAFSLTNYQKLDAPKRKQFLTVATAAIVDQIARTEYENNCRCVWRHGVFPFEWCTVSDTKSVAPVVVRIFNPFSIPFELAHTFYRSIFAEKTKPRLTENCQSSRKRNTEIEDRCRE